MMGKVEIIEQVLNYKGLVKSLDIKPDEYLLPLLEVVVNSIQSIEDKGGIGNGKIVVRIHRLQQKTILSEDGKEPYQLITGFSVTDNGIGFTDERVNAFSTPFTNFNAKKGGKGMGRYTALACFGSMDIFSSYLQNGNLSCRNLRFDNNNGLQNVIPVDVDKITDYHTKVKLNNYKEQYSRFVAINEVSKLDIAESIIQHTLLYFISNCVPTIYICDEGETVKDSIILNDIYKEVIQIERTAEGVKISDIKEEFYINYIKNFNGVQAHSIHLCANNRQVGNKQTLTKLIPSFRELYDNDKKYHLSLYVTSDFLNKKVHPQRNKFMLPEGKDDQQEMDGTSLEELYANVAENVKENYFGFIIEAEKEKNERIKNYILDKEKPRLRFRHLLTIDDAFEDIPINAGNDVVEAKLHEKAYKLELKREKAFERIFKKKKYDKEAFGQIVHKVLREEASFSKDKLADLMIKRKSVIKLFKKYLEWRNEENHMLEEDLHNIIFTMGSDTSNIPDDYHNLWLLDERLTFHTYTTSDKQLRVNKKLKSESAKEPDLFVYDVPWAYADNPDIVNSLVIFEFKRPGRDMNTRKDKILDSQLDEYFEKLSESKAVNHKGRYMKIKDETPKFGYIVCDLHDDLIEYNIKRNGFKKTPHGTLYKVNSELNLYFEVIDYTNLVDFAEKRHEVFFRALGIDNL